MKSIFEKMISCVLAFAMIIPFAACSAERQEEKNPEELMEEAYIYCLPLMIMDATKTKFTNTVEATPFQAPENQIFHALELADASFTDVVTPNVDTVYSQVFLNLSKDAVILELPKTDRFCTVEVLDAFSNCISVIDASKFEKERGYFIFTSESFSDEIPEGMTEIKSPSAMVWLLIRTVCGGKEDLVNVKAIQNEMDCYTYLSGKDGEREKGSFDESNNFVPVEKVLSMSVEEYFERANSLMTENPPAKEDAEIIERLSAVNVGPGLDFDPAVFGENAEEKWNKMKAEIVPKLIAGSSEYMMKNGCWQYFGEPIAEFGTAYIYRALIALMGFGANPVSIAVYPKTEYDSEGNRLSGTEKYRLHFEKDGIPPVDENGFWSITVYDSANNLLIDNELDRYCINDRSGCEFNEDGSLDIYISKEKPEDEKVKNWLPVGEGEFHLFMRIYLPEDEVIENSWKAPIIIKE